MAPSPTNECNNNHATVHQLIRRISQLKREKQWKEADRLKMILLKKHSIQIFCRSDGTIGWAEINEQNQPPVKRISWSLTNTVNKSCSASICTQIPLFIATVNLPHYRSRLAKTLECLSCQSQDRSQFHFIQCIDMLRLDEFPSIGVNRIVFEGWRQLLLPTIFEQYKAVLANDPPFVFIAEDDVRLFSSSPGEIQAVCTKVFRNNPELDLLSLGHRHAVRKPSRRQRRRAKKNPFCESSSVNTNINSSEKSESSVLLNHLKDGGKIHGSTFLAVRYPRGVISLLNAMNSIAVGKRTHFDQFLFHSTDHSLGIAFSDPSFAGWAEVEETLTTAGSGYRREGGGRLEYCPDVLVDGNVKWVCRNIVLR